MLVVLIRVVDVLQIRSNEEKVSKKRFQRIGEKEANHQRKNDRTKVKGEQHELQRGQLNIGIVVIHIIDDQMKEDQEYFRHGHARGQDQIKFRVDTERARRGCSFQTRQTTLIEEKDQKKDDDANDRQVFVPFLYNVKRKNSRVRVDVHRSKAMRKGNISIAGVLTGIADVHKRVRIILGTCRRSGIASDQTEHLVESNGRYQNDEQIDHRDEDSLTQATIRKNGLKEESREDLREETFNGEETGQVKSHWFGQCREKDHQPTGMKREIRFT